MVGALGGAAATAVLRYDVDTEAAQGGLAGLARSAGPPLAALGAVTGALGALTTRAIGNARELQRLGAIAGVSAEEMGAIGITARRNNEEIDDWADALREMQLRLVEARTLGTGPATDALDLLGVSLEELEGKTPIETLGFLRDRLSEVEDSSERLFLADELLGGSTERLQRSLSLTSDEWAVLTKQARESNQVLSNEAVAAAEAAGLAYEELGAEIGALSDRIVLGLAPAIAEALTEINDFLVGAQTLADRVDGVSGSADKGRGFWSRYSDALALTPIGGLVVGLDNLFGLVSDVGEETRLAADAERDLADDVDTATDAIDRQAAGVVTLTEGLRTLSGEIVATASLMSAEEAAAIGIGGAGGAFRNPTADAAIRDLRSSNAPRTPVSERPSDREGALASATRESFRLSLAPLEGITRIAADYDRRIAEANEEGWPGVAAQLEDNKEVAIENYSAAEDTRLGVERNRLLMSAAERLQSLRDEAAGLTASQIELRDTNVALQAAVEAGDTELRDVYINTGLLLLNKIAEESEAERDSARETGQLLSDKIGEEHSRDREANARARRIAGRVFEEQPGLSREQLSAVRSASVFYDAYLDNADRDTADTVRAVDFGRLSLEEQRTLALTGSRSGTSEMVVVNVQIAGRDFDDAVADATTRNTDRGAA